jgi:glutamate--cysteine ligase
MSANEKETPALLVHNDQLLAYFASGETAANERGIGTEHEKFVYRKADGRLVGYPEPGGIRDILMALCQRFGWRPEYAGEHVIAVRRGDEAVTLEPGGQLELSGGIKRRIEETEEELVRHLGEINSVTDGQVQCVSWGLNPFDDIEDIAWVPKPRYGIMREFLAPRGDLAHWMMKTTCTAQPNFDYLSESNASAMMTLGARLAPAVVALFANSPLRRLEDTGMESFRSHIWRHTDPDRTGVPDFMLEDGWGYQEYIDWVLDIPMFFLVRDDEYIEMEGRTFGAFWREGHGCYRATLEDFETHLSTVFPEVRMKRFIEIRSADAGSVPMILALSALWKGLFYDDRACREALRLLELDPDAHRRLLLEAASEGLAAQSVDLLSIADQMVSLSAIGLDRIAVVEGLPSERSYLEPLLQILATQTSSAAILLDEVLSEGLTREQLISRHDMIQRAVATVSSRAGEEDG